MSWCRWVLQSRNKRQLENGESGISTIPTRTSSLLIFLILIFLGWFPSTTVALHETDHRFTVEGRVCGEDGKGIAGVKVIVKDTRSSINAKGITDENGVYKAVLHLHNENQGDPLLIKALDFQKDAKVEFDPDDVQTERTLTVNLGGVCSPLSSVFPQWVYYGLGIGGIVVLVSVGLKILGRKSQRSGNKSTSKKKLKG